jgi:2-polyprenyl-6-methoxyphenol hydroxylase-like FAD-dependent oxidoreductase
MEKIGSTGKVVGVIDATGNTKHQSVTSEFEILRADLARILVDTAIQNPCVKIVYGEYVSALSQPSGGANPVHVEFANGKLPSGEYDLVVAADGILSRTRSLATGRPAKDDTHDIGGFYIAYFTAKRLPSDSPTHSRAYHAPGSRVILTRPSPAGTGVLLACRRQGDPVVQAATTQGVDAQKRLVTSIFAGAGWEEARLLEALKASDDFYFEHLAQVRCAQWSVGHVAFLGDSAHAPTAFTGMGTSLALYGAYILAGELSHAARDGRSVLDALRAYDRTARPFVERVQNSPFRVAKLVFPKTWWGVWILNTFITVCCWLGLPGLLHDDGEKEKETLPVYEWASEH